MKLHEWLDAQGRGSRTKMSKDTGFSRVHVSRVAGGKEAGSPFFWRVVSDYTKGVVA